MQEQLLGHVRPSRLERVSARKQIADMTVEQSSCQLMPGRMYKGCCLRAQPGDPSDMLWIVWACLDKQALLSYGRSIRTALHIAAGMHEAMLAD